MKIIEPNFRLFDAYSDPLTPADGPHLLRRIEQQARVSHRSEDRMTMNTWQRFIQAVVIEHGDWSVTEHVSVSAEIRTDRGITHELVRHRLFSYTQESTRFVRYAHDLEFIYPTGAPLEDIDEWRTDMERAEESYFKKLTMGWTPQQARSVLPNALAATIVVTGNLRNWRHFLLMRTSKETHEDFRRWTVPMLEQFKKIIPLLFDDIMPNERQIDHMRKPR